MWLQSIINNWASSDDKIVTCLCSISLLSKIFYTCVICVLVCICVFVCVYRHVHAQECMWSSKYDLSWQISSFFLSWGRVFLLFDALYAKKMGWEFLESSQSLPSSIFLQDGWDYRCMPPCLDPLMLRILVQDLVLCGTEPSA